MHSGVIQPVKILASCGDFSGTQNSISAHLSFSFAQSWSSALLWLRLHRSAIAAVFVVLYLMSACPLLHAVNEPPFGLDHRITWTTSRVIGSPEPPLPYTVEKTFTNITWQQPLFIIAEPGTDRLFVVQQNGETNRPARVLRLHDNPGTAEVETFLAISDRLVYSFAFHPGYRTNSYIYLFSNGPTSETNRLNRISRFTAGRQPPKRCDPESEQVIIEWRSMGHEDRKSVV